MIFETKQFNIPILKGISEKSLEDHFKLYDNYVKNSNLVGEQIAELGASEASSAKNTYVINELMRRFSFEFDGMRNHELYFESLVDGASPLGADSTLGSMIVEDFGSMEEWETGFKNHGLTRGVGWMCLSYDPIAKKLLNSWIDEQHIGILSGTRIILLLDLWEHAFATDYGFAQKKRYIDDFFENINWSVSEARFVLPR